MLKSCLNYSVNGLTWHTRYVDTVTGGLRTYRNRQAVGKKKARIINDK